MDYERKTINISDDEKVFVRVEQKTGENEVARYQYDNHLGSACLELDNTGQRISYEEYHPFGTTSYRSGRNETEVSLKRYKYNGKERDEETGLYYYGMRYYAAWLGRFVSCDPHWYNYPHLICYNYCANNPIMYVDKDGKVIRPSIKIYYNLGMPKVIHDLGNTNFAKNSYTVEYNYKTKEFDVAFNFIVRLSKDFQTPYELNETKMTLNKENPGLLEQIKEHEFGHVEQFMELLRSDIQIQFMGKIYKGQADNIITSILKDHLKKRHSKKC